MKVSKRILATVVTVVMLMTSLTVPSFAAFTDLKEGTNSYKAVSVLNMLGIINGYDEGNGNFSFKPENNVTRAEFTAMLLRTRGMGNVGSTSLENPPFPDVTTSDVSWAIGNIRTARELGIINGYDDGTFKPNNNVLYEEAIKMIVCALGYGDMGTDGAFWYSKYLMTATSLGFTEGAGGAISVPATRATIANMLYNCLEIKLAENNEITDKTILENDLRLTKNVGYIAANPTISLSAPESILREDEIQIVSLDSNGNEETVVYKVDDASKYNDMLGAEITFYYTTDRDSGYKTLISATVNNVETLELTSDMIVGNTRSSIDYYRSEDEERTNTAAIDDQGVVVYNGKLFGTEKADSTFGVYVDYCGNNSISPMPTIGNVKLLDRDKDKKYDVVFIESYDAWVVSSVTSSNRTVTDSVLRTTTQLVLPESSDIKIVNDKGVEIEFSAIKKGNVLAVKEDAHGSMTVVVIASSVNGKITATSSKKGVTIAGKTYKFSKQAPWITGATALTAPQYGDNGKFYLDIDGNIIAYDKTESAVNQYYGYIEDADNDTSGFEETLRINVLTKANPSGKVYNITTKTKINGASVSSLSDAYIAIGSGANKGIKFTVGSNDTIDELIVAADVDDGQKIEADKMYLLYKQNEIEKTSEWTYDNNRKNLELGGEKIYIGNAQIISVRDGKYQNFSLSSLIDGDKCQVEAFDMDTNNAVKFLIIHHIERTIAKDDTTFPVFTITNIEQNLVDGEKRTILDGYVGKSLKTGYTLSIEDATTANIASSLKKGDVVRLDMDDDGKYYVIGEHHRIFSTENGYRDIAIDQPLGGNRPDASHNVYPKVEYNRDNEERYRVIWGSVVQYDAESEDTRFIVAHDVEVTDSSATTQLDEGWFKNMMAFQYDASASEEDKFIALTDDYKAVLSLLQTTTGATPEVFIYMNTEWSVATLIIVNR